MKRWQFWAGLVISLVLLGLALRPLRLPEVWQALRTARVAWVIPGIAVYFVVVWARAWRWHYLLRPLERIPVRRMFPIVAIGYMGNNIYPARAGELLRAYVLRRRHAVPISASLATIVVERAFDGIVMLGFVFLNLPRLIALTGDSGFAGSIRDLAVWGAVAFLGATLVFLILAAVPRRAQAVSSWFIQRLLPERARASAHTVVDRFLAGLGALRSPADVFMVLVTSIVIWLLETGKYWLVMQAFPFQVSFFALMLMNGIVNLATTLPSAPGYVGTFDAPGIAVLAAFGVKPELAAGYTLLLHAALWLPITLLGAYYMTRESLRWTQVQAELRGERPT